MSEKKEINKKKSLINSQRIYILLTLVMFVGYFGMLLVFTHEKTNYHMDEITAYVAANNTLDNSVSINPEYNKKYSDSAEPYLSQMTVSEGHRFDYKNVIKIYSGDNHPPLHGILIHTISSFFPGKFSKWFAGLVNILFSLLTLYCVQKIVELLTKDKQCAIVISGLYCFCSGILSSATYFRMYHMAMFFATLTVLILLKGFKRTSFWFYLLIGISVFLGVMTHYYMAVFAFFASGIYVICQLVCREFKKALYYVLDMIIAGTVYVILYPYAIYKMFGGNDRSAEVFSNLNASPSVFIGKVLRCSKLVDNQLFSGFGLILLFFILLLGVIGIMKNRKMKQKTADKFDWIKWIIPSVSCLGYLITVSIMTVYETPRYFYPIYALVLLTVFSAVYYLWSKMLKKKIMLIIPILIFALCTAYMFKSNVHYLYRGTSELLEQAENLSQSDCVFVTMHPYDVNSSFLEVSKYNSVTFVSSFCPEDIEMADINPMQGLIIKHTPDISMDVISSYVHEKWPELGEYVVIGEHSGAETAYFPYVFQ